MNKKEKDKRLVARTREMRARNWRLVRIFLLIIALTVAFAIGFVVRGNTPLLQYLGFSSNVTGVTNSDAQPTDAKDVFNSLSARVAEVEDILAKDSLEVYDLNAATEALLNGLSEPTGDSYLRYYSRDRYAALLGSEAEGYAGIGVLFSEYNGQAYAVDVFENSAAQLDGVQAGDFVVAIDGDRSQNWSRSEVVSALNRSEGESVVMTWRRPDTLDTEGGIEFTTTLDCAIYDVTNVVTSLEGEVGYIRVAQITQNSADMVKTAVLDLEDQGANAFVLDLRGNPGGYLTQAVDMASLFISSGAVVRVHTVNGDNMKSTSGSAVTTKPLIVLVDADTAAATEVLAAALKESGRATIVGVTTMGKGSVQVLHELSFGGAIRYTAAIYLTPRGNAIDGVGVTPDVVVDRGEESDAQLDYALAVAANLITD